MGPHPFESELIDALQPIRFYTLATCLYHLFESGIYDTLATHQSLSSQDLASQHGFDHTKLTALLKYLRNEGILDEDQGVFSLSVKGQRFAPFRPWYTMLIGGYGQTFLQLGSKLPEDGGWATRNVMQVGIGSCGISHYDAIPLTRSLMGRVDTGLHRMLDLGCGNGLYLVEFCKAYPEIQAWGVEPDPASYQNAVNLVRQHQLEERIMLTCSSAVAFFRSAIPVEPDFVVLGFVLHEILAQEGEAGAIDFLTQLITRFPDLHLIVIEVDHQIDSPALMRHGLALAYYNPYYLFHPFTCQRLETQAYWEDLFARCDLELIHKELVNPQVDSTGLEVGYLLRKRRA